ncbi:MAG: GtrA family protein [Alphaproteobacteria bacterium]|nr:GtrA family protein [Alphaproteobacteria bacterium]
MLTLLTHKFWEALKQKGLHFLLVGIWNTVFGIGLYTAAVLWLGQRHYLWLSLIVGFIAVVQAYLCHKFFVFKTQGHYLTEFVKFYTVYLVSMPIRKNVQKKPQRTLRLFILLQVVELNPHH